MRYKYFIYLSIPPSLRASTAVQFLLFGRVHLSTREARIPYSGRTGARECGRPIPRPVRSRAHSPRDSYRTRCRHRRPQRSSAPRSQQAGRRAVHERRRSFFRTHMLPRTVVDWTAAPRLMPVITVRPGISSGRRTRIYVLTYPDGNVDSRRRGSSEHENTVVSAVNV